MHKINCFNKKDKNLIPAVIYNKELNINVFIKKIKLKYDLYKLIHRNFFYYCFIKEVQFNPLNNNEVIHVDFFIKKNINVMYIPIKIHSSIKINYILYIEKIKFICKKFTKALHINLSKKTKKIKVNDLKLPRFLSLTRKDKEENLTLLKVY
ncbi:hypothetical protein ACWNYO_00155 [Candidatus Vidania fulgoroideorum]